MCGLFGVVRSPAVVAPDRASEALLRLGVCAEERGMDAAGLALCDGRRRQAPSPARRASRSRDARVDGVHVVKAVGPFRELWRPGLRAGLDSAPVVLGHTRWATQGSAQRIANASPLVTGGLVGTHNGDVDAAELRRVFRLPAPAGDTDSEVLFQALDQAHTDARQQEVLTAMTGRAALAWVRRTRPDRVVLARAAISPLAVAVDLDGNLFWASNPDWFRRVERAMDVDLFTSVEMIGEGTLLVVARSPVPQILRRLTFTAWARPQDQRLMPVVAWRGFTDLDRAADRAALRHRVRSPAVLPAPRWDTPTWPAAADGDWWLRELAEDDWPELVDDWPEQEWPDIELPGGA